MKTAFFQRITSFLILIVACSGFAWAQESQPSGTATVDQEKEDQDAKQKAKKEADEAKRKDRLGMFSEVRNNATLSFGISEVYDSDVFGTINDRQGGSYTLLYPRFFANLEKPTVQLTFDYAGGYRFFNKFTQLNSAMHNGGSNSVISRPRGVFFLWRIECLISRLTFRLQGARRFCPVPDPECLPQWSSLTTSRCLEICLKEAGPTC